MNATSLGSWLLAVAISTAPLFTIPLSAQPPVRYDSGTISGLPARNIGSATMSGRIAAVDGGQR